MRRVFAFVWHLNACLQIVEPLGLRVQPETMRRQAARFCRHQRRQHAWFLVHLYGRDLDLSARSRQQRPHAVAYSNCKHTRWLGRQFRGSQL